jgi:hypothetical protein
MKYKSLRKSVQKIFDKLSLCDKHKEHKFIERTELIFNLMPIKAENFLKEMFIHQQNKWCGYSKSSFYKNANTSMAQFNKYARKLLH